MKDGEPPNFHTEIDVAGLAHRIEALADPRAGGGQRHAEQLLPLILDHIPMAVFWKDRDLRYLGCNSRFAQHAGLASPAHIAGKIDEDLPWASDAEMYRVDDRRVMESGEPKLDYEERQLQEGGRDAWVRTSKIPLRDAAGSIIGVLGMYEDITERKQAEAERLHLREEIIRTQAAALRELSTPLIPIGDGVVALVLVGPIQEARAAQILDALLGGVTAHRASVAIIDVTGVRDVDTTAARALADAARATRLLGAEVVLTGIGPKVAQTLVEIGADLASVATCGTLQAGIERARRRP